MLRVSLLKYSQNGESQVKGKTTWRKNAEKLQTKTASKSENLREATAFEADGFTIPSRMSFGFSVIALDKHNEQKYSIP